MPELIATVKKNMPSIKEAEKKRIWESIDKLIANVIKPPLVIIGDTNWEEKGEPSLLAIGLNPRTGELQSFLTNNEQKWREPLDMKLSKSEKLIFQNKII
jgi:hypothetical protein